MIAFKYPELEDFFVTVKEKYAKKSMSHFVIENFGLCFPGAISKHLLSQEGVDQVLIVNGPDLLDSISLNQEHGIKVLKEKHFDLVIKLRRNSGGNDKIGQKREMMN